MQMPGLIRLPSVTKPKRPEQPGQIHPYTNTLLTNQFCPAGCCELLQCHSEKKDSNDGVKPSGGLGSGK